MTLPETDPEIGRAEGPEPLDARPPCAVRSAGRTDRGRVRPSNEDHFAVAELARTLYVHHTSVSQPRAQYSSHRGHVFLVADGMGGHQAGEVASALGVLTVEAFLLHALKRFLHLAGPDEPGV